MKRPYRATRWRRIWHELKWDLAAWLIVLVVLACLLWPAWKATAPDRSGEEAAPLEIPDEPDEQARPPPGKAENAKCKMFNAK
jgi:hypothetical protein